jgi:hypothetical protein
MILTIVTLTKLNQRKHSNYVSIKLNKSSTLVIQQSQTCRMIQTENILKSTSSLKKTETWSNVEEKFQNRIL